MKAKILLLGILLLVANTFSAQITDTTMGYSLELPANWKQVVKSDSQHIFKDTTYTHKSIISIVKHNVSLADFGTTDSWVRSNFIAYLLSVETSVLPYGTLLYFDSSSTRNKSEHWAPEVWSMFFDTAYAYSEFLIFTDNGISGYEMYVIGDSADMAVHLSTYIGILNSIKLLTQVTGITNLRQVDLSALAGQLRSGMYDIRGCNVPLNRRRRPLAPGVYILDMPVYKKALE